MLLKEIHHRVKNNLQVIASMLRLQSDQIADPQVRELFLESQRRVRAMALVHERLYQAPDLAHINLATYVRTLVATCSGPFELLWAMSASAARCRCSRSMSIRQWRSA